MSEVVIEDITQSAVSVDYVDESVIIENLDVIIGVDAAGNVVEIEDDTAEVLVEGGGNVLYFEAPIEAVELSASDVNGALGAHEELFHYLADSYTRFVYDVNGQISEVLSFRDNTETVKLRKVELIYDNSTLLLKQVISTYYNAVNGTVLLSISKIIEHDSSFNLKSLTVLRS